MTVFLNVIKRILRSKAQLVLMLLLPILPLIPIMLDTSVSERYFKVGVADMDKTELTSAFIEHMKLNAEVKMLDKDSVESDIITSDVNYVIMIDKGFTGNIINNDDGALRGYANKESDITPIIAAYVDIFLNPVKNIAKTASGDEEKFYRGLRNFLSGKLEAVTEVVEKSDINRSKVGWGMAIMFMMFSSVFATTMIITDKENRTFSRSLTAPVSIKSYMLQCILAFLIVSMLQGAVLGLVMIHAFGAYTGASALNIYMLLAVFAFVGVSMGVAVSSFLKTSLQASIVGILIIVFMCVLSGAWGTGVSSDLVKNIMKVTPVSWGISALEKLLNDKSILDILKEMGIMLVFSILFFLLGTWRKADVAK